MKKGWSFLTILLILSLLLVGCKSKKQTSAEGTETTESEPVIPEFAKEEEEMFSDRDMEIGYDESTAVRIQLNGSSATATSDAVQISGTTVTITEEATYILSGSLDDGQIIVNAPEDAKLQLVLDNVDIHSKTSAPLYILEADKVFLTLATDSENILSCGESFVAIDDNNIDAAIFSKQDLTMNGEGSLRVISPAGHGVVSKDDLVITGGSYTVEAASHGVDANDSVRLASASLSVTAGKDGMHAENEEDSSLGFFYMRSGSVSITAQGDGVSASSYAQIEGGTLTIQSGGGSGATLSTDESAKGIKVTDSLLINGGGFTVDSADDAIHSNNSVFINGGSFTIATGDDGVHADEALTVTAGQMEISESYEGLEALDIVISGGDISLVASDDGLNAAGGADSSGFGGTFGGDQFGGGRKDPGGMGGGMSSSSDGSIVISGGELYIQASGDGIDANGTLAISGGFVTVCGPTKGDTATLDYDVSGVITGGTFIGTGASGMAQTFSSSEQGVLSVSVGNQSAGTTVTVTDEDGTTIVTYAPALSFAVVIISTPEMVSGEKYTITVGSSSATFEAD